LGLVNGGIGDKFTSELGTLFAVLAIDITMIVVAIGEILQEVDHAEVYLLLVMGSIPKGLCFQHLSSS
jgi:hypothetical protein